MAYNANGCGFDADKCPCSCCLQPSGVAACWVLLASSLFPPPDTAGRPPPPRRRCGVVPLVCEIAWTLGSGWRLANSKFHRVDPGRNKCIVRISATWVVLGYIDGFLYHTKGPAGATLVDTHQIFDQKCCLLLEAMNKLAWIFIWWGFRKKKFLSWNCFARKARFPVASTNLGILSSPSKTGTIGSSRGLQDNSICDVNVFFLFSWGSVRGKRLSHR